MRLIVLRRAVSDVDNCWHYLAGYNLEAAERFASAFKTTCQMICGQPGIGHQESFRRHAGIRSWRISGFEKYLIFYRVEGEQVEIIRVLHGARNLPRFFRRS